MEKDKDTRVLLELISQPAFCVYDGVISQCNQAASQLFIQPDTAVAELLGDGAEDYQQSWDGSMYLTVGLGGQTAAATVTRTEGFDLFVLDMNPGAAELKAMALSAVYLRQPLSDVDAILQRLTPQLPENDPYLAMLERRIYQLQRMVCNMSDASRYATETPAAKEWMNLDGILQELVEKVSTVTGCRLNCRLPDTPISAPVVRTQLERAIYNLISNAIRASAPEGMIDISLTRRGEKAYLSIRDYGAGIPDSAMGTVFSRFTRNPGLSAGDGIGLGLSLVCSAAVAHGGTVLLDRPAGGGVRFTVSLSLGQEKGAEAILRNTHLSFDYAGERDRALLELSDVLPAEVYLK